MRAACEQLGWLRRTRLLCAAMEQGKKAPLQQAGPRLPVLTASACSAPRTSILYHPVTSGLLVARSLPSALPYHRLVTPVQAALQEGLVRSSPQCRGEVTLGHTVQQWPKVMKEEHCGSLLSGSATCCDGFRKERLHTATMPTVHLLSSARDLLANSTELIFRRDRVGRE